MRENGNSDASVCQLTVVKVLLKNIEYEKNYYMYLLGNGNLRICR